MQANVYSFTLSLHSGGGDCCRGRRCRVVPRHVALNVTAASNDLAFAKLNLVYDLLVMTKRTECAKKAVLAACSSELVLGPHLLSLAARQNVTESKQGKGKATKTAAFVKSKFQSASILASHTAYFPQTVTAAIVATTAKRVLPRFQSRTDC